ncbi:MAG: DUF6226 family protein [Chloroflexi bacterium]|nr:DUF6226 family protein [Chloroflexota bacterium]
MRRWGIEGPPEEACSRVTNPERFQPLYDFALSMVARLEADFDVERVEGVGIDEGLERGTPVRPTVRLVPADPDSAPLVVAFVAFSDLPEVRVRAGRWCQDKFPDCACDACDETADEEIARLTGLVEDVTAGRFIESVEFHQYEHSAGAYWELWKDPGWWQRTGFRVPQDRTHQWEPWPLRMTT